MIVRSMKLGITSKNNYTRRENEYLRRLTASIVSQSTKMVSKYYFVHFQKVSKWSLFPVLAQKCVSGVIFYNGVHKFAIYPYTKEFRLDWENVTTNCHKAISRTDTLMFAIMCGNSEVIG